MKHYLIIFLLTLLAFLIHGYFFGVNDQEIFIPYILKVADPSLFTRDLLFNQPSANTSIFYPLFGVLVKFIDIQILFILGYLIFQFFLFTGIYSLARAILNLLVERVLPRLRHFLLID